MSKSGPLAVAACLAGVGQLVVTDMLKQYSHGLCSYGPYSYGLCQLIVTDMLKQLIYHDDRYGADTECAVITSLLQWPIGCDGWYTGSSEIAFTAETDPCQH